MERQTSVRVVLDPDHRWLATNEEAALRRNARHASLNVPDRWTSAHPTFMAMHIRELLPAVLASTEPASSW